MPRSYRLGTQEDIDAVKALISADVLYARSGIDTGLTFNTLTEFFRPYRAARHEWNQKMIEKINARLPDVKLDYDKDVLPLSMEEEEGVKAATYMPARNTDKQ